MRNFVSARYDADAGIGKTMAQRYGVDGFPGFIVLDAAGNKVDDFSGFRPPPDMIRRLQQARAR